MHSSKVVEAVAVTAELCGRTFTPAAAAIFVQDLAQYPEPAVLSALARCRREVRGMLTLADVIARIDDGRPTADEAWAEIPMDEASTVVWCEEARAAHALVAAMLAMGDRIGARMAFRDHYNRLIGESRSAGKPVEWKVSLGQDPSLRAGALQRAAEKRRITYERADMLSPIKIENDAFRLSSGKPNETSIAKHLATVSQALGIGEIKLP